jgi:PAS domain S-box-containing protein
MATLNTSLPHSPGAKRSRLSLATFFTRLVWLCMLPLLLLAVWLAVDSVRTEQSDNDLAATNLVKNFATAIDHYLDARIAALNMLAVSSLLDDVSRREDLYQEAQGFHRSFGTHVILADLGEPKRMLFNTRVPFGTELPLLPKPEGNVAVDTALETARPAVGDIFFGPIAKETLVAIAVPAMREGKPVFLLLTIIETSKINRRLDQVNLPDGWSLTLFDGRGEIIAGHTKPDLSPEKDSDGAARFVAKSITAPWSVALEIPRRIYWKPVIAAVATLTAGMLCATLASLLGGVLAGRRLGRSVASLAETTPAGERRVDIVEVAEARRLLKEAAERRAAAESILRQSEEKLRLFIEHAPVAIAMFDCEMKYLAVSRRWLSDYRLGKVDLVGRPHYEVFPEIPEHWKTAHLKGLKGEVLQADEDAFLRADGSLQWLRWVLQPWYTAEKDIGGIVIFTEDITAHKQTEEALHSSKDLMQSIVDNSTALIYVFDKNMRLLICNKALSELVGLPVSELVGKRRKEFLPQELAERDEENDRRVIEAGSPQQFEEAGTFEGKAATFLTIKFPLRNEHGGIWGIGGISTDITKRKQAEEDLRESDERFRLGFENANIGMCLVDTQGRLLKVNRQMSEMFGYSKAELEGMSVNDITHPDYLDISPNFMRQAQKREIDHSEFEKAYIHKQGHIVWGHISISLVRNAVGEPLYFISHVIDITERKDAEQEREKLQAQLNQAQKMEAVGRLSGGVAHDFNNMLGVILGFTDLAALKLPKEDPIQMYLEEVKTAAQRSADITRQLLAFARKQIIAPEVLDLNDTIANMLKMLKRLIGEDIDLLWKPAEDLWPVMMDPAQVDQILANLMVNARDAITSVGKISIETRNVELDEPYCQTHDGLTPGRYVILEITDDGCGMGKETLANIFEPFFTTKEIGKGTGLGLATVYGIVKQNSGYIEVDSEPGQGTSFKIYLPRQELKEAANEQLRKPAKIPTGIETVLLVEDEKSLLKFTRMLLEELGYTVLSSDSPIAAIQIAKECNKKIHLLITDVVMPEMSGRDLCMQVQTSQPNLKCLFMSGYTADVIAHHGVLDEGVQFLQKPFSREALATKIRDVLS